MTCRIDGCDAERMPKQALCREHRNARDRRRRACDALAAEAQGLGMYEPVPEVTAQPKPSMLPTHDVNGKTIVVIPDTQVKANVPLEHFVWIGRYINELRPDTVVHLGDHYDFPSLSRYDCVKKKVAQGHDTDSDLAWPAHALSLLMSEIDNPGDIDFHICWGNHEKRRDDFVAEGVVRLHDPRDTFAHHGWTVHEFLDIVDIAGWLFSHYFVVNKRGTVGGSKFGKSSAFAQAMHLGQSSIAGHRQGFEHALRETQRGPVHGIIAGSCMQHHDEYLTGQGKNLWRGIITLHDAVDGDARIELHRLVDLRRRYGC